MVHNSNTDINVRFVTLILITMNDRSIIETDNNVWSIIVTLIIMYGLSSNFNTTCDIMLQSVKTR